MLTQTQAVAIILEYDTVPVSLLTKSQKAALAAAKDVNKDTASRAVTEFIGHESSKRYVVAASLQPFSVDKKGNVNIDLQHHAEKSLPVTTLNEFHD